MSRALVVQPSVHRRLTVECLQSSTNDICNAEPGVAANGVPQQDAAEESVTTSPAARLTVSAFLNPAGGTAARAPAPRKSRNRAAET